MSNTRSPAWGCNNPYSHRVNANSYQRCHHCRKGPVHTLRINDTKIDGRFCRKITSGNTPLSAGAS
jgi:hypothetical protein